MRLAKQLTLSWVANAVALAVVTAVLSGVKVDTRRRPDPGRAAVRDPEHDPQAAPFGC